LASKYNDKTQNNTNLQTIARDTYGIKGWSSLVSADVFGGEFAKVFPLYPGTIAIKVSITDKYGAVTEFELSRTVSVYDAPPEAITKFMDPKTLAQLEAAGDTAGLLMAVAAQAHMLNNDPNLIITPSDAVPGDTSHETPEAQSTLRGNVRLFNLVQLVRVFLRKLGT
jgi:hypothetical protein